MKNIEVKSGIPALDKIINHIWIGDNVVWKVERLEDYIHYARAFAASAVEEGRTLQYIRFAPHQPILENLQGINVHYLDPTKGFQQFSFEIYDIITNAGKEVFYIFDSLSALQQTWATDLMIGNFFNITCPYLFELDTVAYFCLMRNKHDFNTVSRILDTTQIMIELYPGEDGTVVKPRKVWERNSETMLLPHIWQDEELIPQIDGIHNTLRLPNPIVHAPDYWEQIFLMADSLRWMDADDEQIKNIIYRLCSILLGKDEKILSLAKKYFSLDDLLGIRSRMIGTGYRGGKAVGMLLARKILSESCKERNTSTNIQKDSLDIGSDVWQTYLIYNGLWTLYMKQRTNEGYFSAAEELREKILVGNFPSIILSQFTQALDALGNTPIIIRSSSLLEDGYGNAFAGKYQSVFCSNQGTLEERMNAFLDAVRTVYASTVEYQALVYRKKRGLDKLGEQMSILIQRVSGTLHGNYYYPLVAGVGLSYSSYIWHQNMDPKKVMIRIVYGLGTRAVDRVDSDYTRIVSLDMPEILPSDLHDYNNTQSKMDVLDIVNNKFCTIPIKNTIKDLSEKEEKWVISHDTEAEKRARSIGMKNLEVIKTDFRKLFNETNFLENMKNALAKLEKAYKCPVDIEFTMNKIKDTIEIEFVQCRPLQTIGIGGCVDIPKEIPVNKTIFSLTGGFLGGGSTRIIKNIVYINPSQYLLLTERKRYEVARAIGKLNIFFDNENESMLIVPGRCGTTMASLGVPVKFAEINRFAAICEESYPSGGLIPELSFGSHFFQDIVEANIFYASFFPEKVDSFNTHIILNKSNQLKKLIPECTLDEVIHVAIFNEEVLLMSNPPMQKAVCFIK